MLKKLLIIILLLSLVSSVLPFSEVLAEPWNPGSPPHPYLTPKWAGYVIGGGEALITADVRSDIPGEEVFHAGGPVQPSNQSGRVTALNGLTGYEIWRRDIVGIGDTATLQMADIELDGRLEIIVALQHPAGLYILNAEDGSTLWNAPGFYNINGTDYPGYVLPIGGRVDGSGVMGDTDGDGYPNIFLGIMAYLKYPNTGKIIQYEWDPTVGSIVEFSRVRVWHPCAGGLALGDTDNDGVFELYVNERDVYFGDDDGSWGRGLASFWANNLTLRWRIYYWGASSNIPMLADVNKDGIVDVISTNLGTGIAVLNSTDGHPLRNSEGTLLYDQDLGVINSHYQSSVYDIDGDGNLELLGSDGTSDYPGTQVWDLYDWKLDATLDSGLNFRGPSIGNVAGGEQMEIIQTSFDPQNVINGSAVQVYDRNYRLIDSFDGLRHRAIGSVVQDIDRDDGGLNELLILTQGGVIYAFDTPGLSEERQGRPRARSEIHFYSESRLGVSEYVPYERRWPDVIAPNPAPDSMNVSTSLNQLSFTLNHPLGQTMSYVVTTSPNIGSGGGSDVGNGLRTVSISGLKASTTYYWRVEAVDSSGRDTTKNYWFTTAPVYSNSFPTQGTPVLNSTEGGNTPQEDLTAYNQTTTDQDGDKTTNVYNWLKGSGSGTSITNLVLPFDTKPNPHDIYSGTATTRDYSGYSNNGDVFGAAWTQGRVGGAFSFDGNDFIRVEEQGNSLDGGGSWSAISIEFWIRATRMGSTEKLIWKPDRYNRTTVSYEIDFRYRDNPRRLEFTWRVNTTDGLYTTSYYRTTQLTSWHHVMFTYKSGVGLRIYFDGTQVAQNLNSARTGNIVDTDGPLEIAFNSGSDFAGILDEIRLYPSQMSSAFLSQRYQDTRDGSSDKSSMPAEDIVIGDIWVVQVTPNDGQQDGQTLLSNQITVGKTDQAPSIDWYSPSNSIVSIIERQFIDFKQVSSNQDGGPLSFQWILDSVNQATTQNWTSPNLSVGTHIVQVTVSDGIHSTYQRWTVTVQTRPPNPAQYTLYIQTSGVGTTNPSDNRLYYAGDAVSVQALPESGWTLDYWLLDNKNVGSSNPYVLILDDNHVLVAVFKGNPQTFPWEILIPISTVSLVAASAILYFRKKRPDP